MSGCSRSFGRRAGLWADGPGRTPRSITEGGGGAAYGVTRSGDAAVAIDDRNAPRPDVMVFDQTGLDVRTVEQIPVEKAVLAVEVVSAGSRLADRFAKPALYAAAGIASYWRVERDENDLPVVHEFWLHHESGVYAPSPERPLHTGKLVTSVPFPVDIGLRELIEA
ncbi:Uma2 family endonuclease [Streptomyces chrestomyceticus]|uniref:Uma2 family endonuclease n=1 Tax=Streptomyces chrestomyceticus TaxID=68185 RepID=UPI0033C43C84